MKIKLLLILLLLSINSFGVSKSKSIPEATKFHSELYTIQFTLAVLSEDFQLIPPSEEEITNYVSLGRKSSKKDPQVERIVKSNPTYTNLETVFITPDKSFNKGVVEGVWNSKSRTLKISQITIPNYGIIKNVTLSANLGEWHSLIVGGKEQKYAILIKCYEPKK